MEGNVVSHFYGEVPDDSTPATNDRTLHHEYWLMGMVRASEEKATFARPSVSGEGLFTQSSQEHGDYYFNQVYTLFMARSSYANNNTLHNKKACI